MKKQSKKITSLVSNGFQEKNKTETMNESETQKKMDEMKMWKTKRRIRRDLILIGFCSGLGAGGVCRSKESLGTCMKIS